MCMYYSNSISVLVSVAAAQRSVSVCGEAREAVGEGGGPGGDLRVSRGGVGARGPDA